MDWDNSSKAQTHQGYFQWSMKDNGVNSLSVDRDVFSKTNSPTSDSNRSRENV